MKKTILGTAILTLLLLGCKDNKSDKAETSETTETVQKEETAHKHGQETAVSNNDWVNTIKLDNGRKWEANPETNEGVDKMLKLIESGNPKIVGDYHNLASKLNEEKNFVIRKCTMEGPSHDNLHVFLHPLIDKIKALGEVSTAEKGAEITAGIKENLEGYYTYFK